MGGRLWEENKHNLVIKESYQDDGVVAFVDMYHVDTQEGLNILVKALKKYNFLDHLQKRP